MPLQVRHDSFLTGSSNGNKSITGVGFQPKALILFGSAKVVGGAGFDVNSPICVGFGVSATQRKFIRFGGTNGAAIAANNTFQIWAKDKLFHMGQTPANTQVEFDLVSMDPDGFTINLTSAFISHTVYYLALGGTQITNAAIGQFRDSAANPQAVPVGFKPDLVLVACMQKQFPQAANVAGGGLWIGAAAAPTQRGTAGRTGVTSALPTNAATYQRNDKLLVCTDGLGNITRTFDLQSFDENGFTVQATTVTAGEDIIYLAIKGGRYWVGPDTQKTSAGTKSKTGVGFQPNALLAFGNNQPTSSTVNTSNGRLSLGASDGTRNGNCWAEDVAAANPSIATTYNRDTTNFLTHNTSPSTQDAIASVSTLDADGYTLNWTTADAVAREFIVVAFGQGTEPPLASAGAGDRTPWRPAAAAQVPVVPGRSTPVAGGQAAQPVSPAVQTGLQSGAQQSAPGISTESKGRQVVVKLIAGARQITLFDKRV